MKHATPAVIDHDACRFELQEKRRKVLQSLGVRFDTLARMGRVAEDDQAQITHEEFISLRRNSLDYLQLRLVDEALVRLETGDFGACQACGEPIAAKRLRALPWARYCLDCQCSEAEEVDREQRSARTRVLVPV